jgi:chromosome segregation ATPase
MNKKIFCLAVALCVSAFFLISCSGGKNAADIAIKAAEEAVNATKAEAAKVVPDEVKSLEDSLAAVKEKFVKGEYKAALEEATALSARAKEVLDAAKAKKEELTGKWTEMSQGLPKMFEDIQGKVDGLSKLKKLPASLTKEKFEEAKASASAKTNVPRPKRACHGDFSTAVSMPPC